MFLELPTTKGKALFEAPPPELATDPVEALVRGNPARGITPYDRSGAPKWRWDRDIPWEIDAAALEALDPVERLDPPEARPAGSSTRRKLHPRRKRPQPRLPR